MSRLLFGKAVLELRKQIRSLCAEAAKQGKDLEVSALHHCEDRPTIDGHYAKYKFDYRFVERGDPSIKHEWVRYDCSGVIAVVQKDG